LLRDPVQLGEEVRRARVTRHRVRARPRWIGATARVEIVLVDVAAVRREMREQVAPTLERRGAQRRSRERRPLDGNAAIERDRWLVTAGRRLLDERVGAEAEQLLARHRLPRAGLRADERRDPTQ